MKRVITYGTYDVLHYGHINLLKRARALGDYLIVVLSTDEFNAVKNKKSYYTYEQRKAILEACRYVDLVVPEYNWEQKIDDVQKYFAGGCPAGEAPRLLRQCAEDQVIKNAFRANRSEGVFHWNRVAPLSRITARRRGTSSPAGTPPAAPL